MSWFTSFVRKFKTMPQEATEVPDVILPGNQESPAPQAATEGGTPKEETPVTQATISQGQDPELLAAVEAYKARTGKEAQLLGNFLIIGPTITKEIIAKIFESIDGTFEGAHLHNGDKYSLLNVLRHAS
jgi:hypothetical protein